MKSNNGSSMRATVNNTSKSGIYSMEVFKHPLSQRIQDFIELELNHPHPITPLVANHLQSKNLKQANSFFTHNNFGKIVRYMKNEVS